MTPVLSEDQVKETAQKFKDFLLKKGAEFVYEENWGLRKLAYKIKNKSTGFYQLFEFKIDTQAITDFEIQLKRDERIMRYQTVTLDKFGVLFNERHRAKIKENNEQGPKPVVIDEIIN